MTDPFRLPRHIVPERYDLRLEPDLARATFSGSALITVTVREPSPTVLLNAAELDIHEATVVDSAGRRLAATIERQDAQERLHLSPSQPLTPGAWTLHLTFAGLLNDKLRGFYRSSYKDASGATHVLAATQFEATDARRAFPCWDEPDFKAVFATTLVVDPSLTAVSNTARLSERIEGGKKLVTFADTIRMSTYLVAFIVGRLEGTEPRLVGRTPVRLWAVPGKRHLTSFGLDIAAFSLAFFEDYYGLPYPGDKLDLLAIPDFASGAMENLGAITFRETALLADERAATHLELERVADVVAHENAHMWFGDLVTMSWWNGLWLNEAFATFMEVLAVDAWKPEWQRWTNFGVSRAAAMIVDGLQATRPIEYPVRAPKDADAMFDVLTYEKGASVLRMLEQHIGPNVFREGVRRYLQRHLYGNADTKDLWIALGDAARQDIPALMDGWIFQEGYPLIKVTKEGTTLRLSQERFTYLPFAVRAGSSRAAVPSWHVPVQIRLTTDGTSGNAATVKLLLTERETRLPLSADMTSILVNEGGHGFYRVQYQPDLLQTLLRQPGQLAPIERFNLINDAWAATVAGLTPLADYLAVTAQFRGERDRNVWTVLIESFHFLDRLVRPTERPRLEVFIRDRLGPAVAELGWEPTEGEDELTRQLRGDLLRALGTIGNDAAVQARAAEVYARALAAPEAVDANVLQAVIAVLAHTGDDRRYEDFLQRFQQAATPQDERRYLYALAAFQPAALLARTIAHTLDDTIRTQDGPFILRLLLLSVYGREQAWAFIKTNWDRLDQLFPKSGLRRMCDGLSGLATPELEEDVLRFVAERKIDLGGKTLAQYLEQLRIAVTFREREGATLSRFIAT